MEVDRVLAYADVVTKMVWWCQTHSWSDLEEQVGPGGHLHRPDATFLDLVRAVDCEQSTVDYYTSINDQTFVKRVRHEECKEARRAIDPHPLAALVIHNIETERAHMLLTNRARAVEDKMLCAGYGLFHQDFVDAVLPDALEDFKHRITLESNDKGQLAPVPYVPEMYKLSRRYDPMSIGSSRCSSPAGESIIED